MIEGKVTVWRGGEIVQEGPNIVTSYFSQAAANAITQQRDERVMIAKFGDGDTPATLASRALSGSVLLSRETTGIVFPRWDTVKVSFALDLADLPAVTVREIGLFTNETKNMFSHYVLSPAIIPGSALYNFDWTFFYTL